MASGIAVVGLYVKDKSVQLKSYVTGVLIGALVAFGSFGSPAYGQAPEASPPSQGQSPQRTISAEEAFVMIRDNAKKGDPGAMLTLGSFYEQGIGVPRNFVSAMEWYRKAAEADLPEGQYNLGVCYEIGMGNSGDIKKAAVHFQKAAEMGLGLGMQKLASMYLAGNGVTKNNAVGLEWMAKAAAAGHAESANMLGVVYSQGLLDQKKDEGKAFVYFTQAADLGHLEAIKNLAVIYKEGLGRPKDPAQALKWYLVAQKGGYQAADLDLVLTELRGLVTSAQAIQAKADADAWVEALRKKTGDGQNPADRQPQ